MPARKKYGRFYEACLELREGADLRADFGDDKECKRVYEAFRQWALREGHADLRIAKRGTTLYVERAASD